MVYKWHIDVSTREEWDTWKSSVNTYYSLQIYCHDKLEKYNAALLAAEVNHDEELIAAIQNKIRSTVQRLEALDKIHQIAQSEWDRARMTA